MIKRSETEKSTWATGCYLRVDMATQEIKMDDAQAINALIGYGDAVAEANFPKVRDEFLIKGQPAERWSASEAG